MATVAASAQGTIDVASIVSQLMTVERRPLTKLAQREAGIQARITAFGTVKGALSTFQSSLANLNKVATFQSVKATSSDESQVKVSAANASSRGNHTVRITALASAHAVASANFASRDSIVGTGTITIQRGTFATGAFTANGEAPSKTITIGASQSSMTGIRDAVNAANAGVTASIVNDGTGERLVFASSDGAANSLKITVADADASHADGNGLSALAFDPAATVGAGRNLSEMRPAQNASAIINGITVTSATNTFASALDGVTITALQTGTNAATVKIEHDTSGIKSSLEGFVKAYNDLRQQLRAVSGFDAATKQAGPLNGDSTVRAIESELRRLVTAQVDTRGPLQSLKDIGIALDRDGVLKLDNAKLQKQLEADPVGLARLFAKSGFTSDSRVSFTNASSETSLGVYDVSITQVATRGALTGNAVAGLGVTTGVNDTLSFTIDGVQATITLAAGAYATADALAAEVQSKLAGNGTLSGAGVGATVSATGGILTVTSNRYGAASNVAVSGNAATGIFGAAPVTTTGLDVAGTIGTLAATGRGQLLTGSGVAKGLEIRISSSTTGTLGTVNYFEGIAARIDARLADVLGRKGSLQSKADGLDASVKDLRKLADAYSVRMTAIEARYRKQFSSLDASLARMQSTSTYLQQQLTSIAANTASR